MLRGFSGLAVAVVVALAALVGPTVALADGCGDGSATSIYSECVPKATGTHPHKPVVKKQATTPPASTTPTYTYTQTTPRVTPVKPHRHHHVGTHRVVHPRDDHPKHVNSVLVDSPTKKENLGSTFDLGAGPTAFFALLLGTVLVLLGTGGVRSWRNRHRV
jgi:hypothetical protein